MDIKREITSTISAAKAQGANILLLGPRQTGKTTLTQKLTHDRSINFMNQMERQKYEQSSGSLINEIRALKQQLKCIPTIVIDEIQKVPEITDAVQVLIDEKAAQFILTGSSARKIKNLLPGRVIRFELAPLTITEISNWQCTLEEILTNGTLPGILNITDPTRKEQTLASYVSLYLEEEIRKEALVRNLGAFANFLRLACIESGNIVNLSSISQEIGVSHSTIAEYYKILLDCMLIRKIDPITKSTGRRNLTKSSRYLVFDLGVRRLGAKESAKPTTKQFGKLFEQFVGLELQNLINISSKQIRLMFWRDHTGPEVDFVLEEDGKYTPIEVKYTSNPTKKDIKHLLKFQHEYPIKDQCYVICQTQYAMEMADGIFAIPWQDLATIL